MLTLDQLKLNYSEEVFKKNPKAVLVEYLQYELLDSIYKQSGSENLSFIGGTAIRIVYESKRFSEDLDFDNFGLSFKEFSLLLGKVKIDMELKGLEVEFRLIEKGAYHCYIKFPNLLFGNQLSGHGGEKILVRLDATLKIKLVEPTFFLLNKFDVYRRILVNSPSVLLIQKLIAVAERKRAKGRDYYDVSYLFGLTDPDYDFLRQSFNLTKEELSAKILSRVSSLNLAELARDVLPFLLDPNDVERVLSFDKFIEQKFKK